MIVSKLPKAKCEKCEHCKLITPYDVIICDYLNNFQSLYVMAYIRPERCSNYERAKSRLVKPKGE
jgi:hypothetical protein